jgi:4-carboxymuconolactone decarboxylase
MDRYEQGRAKLHEVYDGDVVPSARGESAFHDVMMTSLFADVWGRDVLSIRDRRLLLMGVIAAGGLADIWTIQARAALKRQELTPDELRETLIILAPYAGYPKVSALILRTEEIIAELQPLPET